MYIYMCVYTYAYTYVHIIYMCTDMHIHHVYPICTRPRCVGISLLPPLINTTTKQTNLRTLLFAILRWHNHLDPRIRKGPWTPEEEQIIIDAQGRWGNKWSQIANLLPGRSVQFHSAVSR